MSATLRVHRIFQGHGLSRRVEIQVPGKPGFHFKHEYVGSLWSMRTWIPAGEHFSRGDAVVRIGRQLWRLREKTAVPLAINSHEHFRPWNWHEGEAFVITSATVPGRAKFMPVHSLGRS